jgi:hypothetical protein
MRWLFVIIVSITSCLAGGEHPTLRHEKPSNVALTKNNTLADYKLVPLSRSFFCHPPRAQEGPNLIKLKKAAVKSNRMEELKGIVKVLIKHGHCINKYIYTRPRHCYWSCSFLTYWQHHVVPSVLSF